MHTTLSACSAYSRRAFADRLHFADFVSQAFAAAFAYEPLVISAAASCGFVVLDIARVDFAGNPTIPFQLPSWLHCIQHSPGTRSKKTL